ncbi:MAG: hypothetical protein IT428_01650 [Planctomycetaceae bacterium]|nr:hypothetical protein [Planctomycetaceae bacterium]
MPNLARRMTWVVLCACFVAFSVMALSPLWYRLTHVDIDGWPLGVPHPDCPACHNMNGSSILEMTGDVASFQCSLCGHLYTARPPRSSR